MSSSTLPETGKVAIDPAAGTVPARSPDLSSKSMELRSILKDRRGPLSVLAIASVLSGLTESGVLAVLAQSAAALVNGVSQVHVHLGPVDVNETIGVLLVFGLILAFVRLALQLVLSAVPSRLVADTQQQLRITLFAAFTRASWREQSRDREGQLQELVTNQVFQAVQSVVWATTLIISVLTFAVLVASALALNVLAALIVLVAATGLFALLRPLSNLGANYARGASRQSVTWAGEMNEAVRVAEEAHVFGAGVAQRARAESLVAPLTESIFRANFIARLVGGVYQSLIYLLVVAALTALYLIGSTQVASLAAVVLLLVRAGMYGQQAQSAYTSVRQAVPYLERLQHAEQRYTASIPVVGDQPLSSVRDLAFQSVCFGYERDRMVLADIDFEVSSGETIGIVGPSGAGKSTLVQLLLRLRAPDSGRYLVNATPADAFGERDWHTRFAYVPQEPRLLHAPVADNIRFFRDIDQATVEHAARLAGIHHDIQTWSSGYDTVIGPRADAISGGQRQRICLARALAGNPDVLVLDEPTSALDPHSEALIQESLAALKHKLTVFVVAHRMSTLDICERVMVVVDGRLDAFDRIDALRIHNAYYRSVTESRHSSPVLPSNGP